jgi:hypothetical protein
MLDEFLHSRSLEGIRASHHVLNEAELPRIPELLAKREKSPVSSRSLLNREKSEESTEKTHKIRNIHIVSLLEIQKTVDLNGYCRLESAVSMSQVSANRRAEAPLPKFTKRYHASKVPIAFSGPVQYPSFWRLAPISPTCIDEVKHSSTIFMHSIFIILILPPTKTLAL